jgi:hypothetical protein
MLNKTNLIGRLLPIGNREREKDNDRKDSVVYFSLLVPNPSSSITVLRCLSQGDAADFFEKNDIENENDTILEVKGYLRNEKGSRQIIVKGTEIKKLDTKFEEIDEKTANQVRLLGKIITNLRDPREDGGFLGSGDSNDDVLSFKMVVPRENSNSSSQNVPPIFFCRVQGDLKEEFRKNLKKGDVVLVEGFLQTKKIVEDGRRMGGFESNFSENSGDYQEGRKISRISSIICSGFTLIENDSASEFVPHDKLEIKRISREIKKINFDKPKDFN